MRTANTRICVRNFRPNRRRCMPVSLHGPDRRRHGGKNRLLWTFLHRDALPAHAGEHVRGEIGLL